ncbi:type 1 fimbrial protein [Yersinia massiliensis]|jgi:major type 1 subunit fimbrin (pilin)|uniref:Type 1 fimbrial protein n=3 Tax=Yersinia TaxID=629 RepID=A0A2R4NRY2_9GAMM|nr:MULTISPECIES: fimbrial protein [Yersinia]HEC1652011.1 type 1 fimbrial protein [Yersinia enterocolitica]ATM85278.1 type 1 fimbrial protein [Yersinia frederiksenii]AVX38873.1 type 1 fimbrial protein [Yersinia massiliensis]MCB5308017.1 type 1 fimbrial protein [Yersinia massiliensis]MCB5316248.1 type 1 fimbrial protein [Yersinia massiliensis]
MKIKTTSALIAAITGLFIAQSAFATDGTITINGQITDTTCGVSVNNGTKDGTVNLPTISASALSTINSVAGTTPFSIVLSGCSGASMNNAYAYFEPGATVETSTGRLNSNGTSTGVQVRLLNKNSSPIMVGGAGQSSVVEDISGGGATLAYYAQYYANNASVGAGTVTTQVDYTIVYD